MKKEDIVLYSWVIRGKQRRAVIAVMDRPMTPKQISVNTSLKFSNTSDVLRAMVKQGLAICLNPKQKTGRLYDLTTAGKRIKKQMSE